MTGDIDSRKVYLIDSGEYTKIGYSVDPETRQSSIQSHNPNRVTLTGTIETDDAERLERTLHTRLAEYRCEMGGGEWFALPNDVHEVLAEAEYLTSIGLKETPTHRRREDRREDRRSRRKKKLRTPPTDREGNALECRVRECSNPANAVMALSESVIEGALEVPSDEWATHLFAEGLCACCFADDADGGEYIDQNRLQEAERGISR